MLAERPAAGIVENADLRPRRGPLGRAVALSPPGPAEAPSRPAAPRPNRPPAASGAAGRAWALKNWCVAAFRSATCSGDRARADERTPASTRKARRRATFTGSGLAGGRHDQPRRQVEGRDLARRQKPVILLRRAVGRDEHPPDIGAPRGDCRDGTADLVAAHGVRGRPAARRAGARVDGEKTSASPSVPSPFRSNCRAPRPPK